MDTEGTSKSFLANEFSDSHGVGVECSQERGWFSLIVDTQAMICHQLTNYFVVLVIADSTKCGGDCRYRAGIDRLSGGLCSCIHNGKPSYDQIDRILTHCSGSGVPGRCLEHHSQMGRSWRHTGTPKSSQWIQAIPKRRIGRVSKNGLEASRNQPEEA